MRHGGLQTQALPSTGSRRGNTRRRSAPAPREYCHPGARLADFLVAGEPSGQNTSETPDEMRRVSARSLGPWAASRAGLPGREKRRRDPASQMQTDGRQREKDAHRERRKVKRPADSRGRLGPDPADPRDPHGQTPETWAPSSLATSGTLRSSRRDVTHGKVARPSQTRDSFQVKPHGVRGLFSVNPGRLLAERGGHGRTLPSPRVSSPPTPPGVPSPSCQPGSRAPCSAGS